MTNKTSQLKALLYLIKEAEIPKYLYALFILLPLLLIGLLLLAFSPDNKLWFKYNIYYKPLYSVFKGTDFSTFYVNLTSTISFSIILLVIILLLIKYPSVFPKFITVFIMALSIVILIFQVKSIVNTYSLFDNKKFDITESNLSLVKKKLIRSSKGRYYVFRVYNKEDLVNDFVSLNVFQYKAIESEIQKILNKNINIPLEEVRLKIYCLQDSNEAIKYELID